jgi:hypothetical protein
VYTAACWDLVVLRREPGVRRVWVGEYDSLPVAIEHVRDVQAAYSGRYAFTFAAVVAGDPEFLEEIAERRLWLDAERSARFVRAAADSVKVPEQLELFALSAR